MRGDADVAALPTGAVTAPLPPPVVASVAPVADAAVRPEIPGDDPARWAPIDAAVQAALAAGKLPGCVVVVGRHDDVLFQRAYGARALLPDVQTMTTDTVFDLASLTKAVATSTSIMILVDRGKIDVDARAATYVPELGRLPPFTVRQLLVHTSGLPAVTPMSDWSPDRAELMRRLGGLTLKAQPGERFLYSDVGYVILQEIVQRASAKSLAAFASDEVFRPLGMTETGYLPAEPLRVRTAPTEMRDGGFMQGEVHDPRAFALGGVSGNAGVFSTASDLSRFARAMLGRGVLDGRRLYSDAVFERTIARQPTSKGGRALGWDVDSTFATHRSPLLSARAFGHGGYTGTAMWIDPEKDLFVVFLSNRVHPEGKGAVNPLIAEVASLAVTAAEVKPGIDVLRAESFQRLAGAHVALVTNGSAKAKDGTTTIDALRAAPGVKLETIFTPEHGINGDREGVIGDSTYAGIPVHSLYGERYSPTAESLAKVDTIVFDLQDVGVRFYTYASTMKRAMKVANDRHLRFVVLDRPNPIGGVEVQGPVLDGAPDQLKRAFVNHHPLPLRHGLTMGELARMFQADDAMTDLRLEVVRMVGWRRKDPFALSGLPWAAPSPNLRSLRSVALYPAIGLLESTNVSVGRGTELPFEIVAAPWLDSAAVVGRLKELALSGAIGGVTFEPAEVTPRSSVHAGKKCKAVKVTLVDPTHFEPVRTALAIASVLRELHGTTWTFDSMDSMLRWPAAMEAIRSGKDLAAIEATWATGLAAFKAHREAFLLYR